MTDGNNSELVNDMDIERTAWFLRLAFFGSGLLAFFLGIFVFFLQWNSTFFLFHLAVVVLVFTMILTFYGASNVWGQPGEIFIPPQFRNLAGKALKHFTQDADDENEVAPAQPASTREFALRLMEYIFFGAGLLAFYLGVFVLLIQWQSSEPAIPVSHLALVALLFAMIYAFQRVSQIFRLTIDTLKQQTLEDPLTNVFNSRYLDMRLKKESARVARHGGSTAVLYLDLDKFKLVNDRYGHAAGDMVLTSIAGFLARGVRTADIVARAGGDEFVAVLPDTTQEEARVVAERVLRTIDKEQFTITENQNAAFVTASLGLAVFPDDAEDIEQVLAMADAATYKAKRAGGNGLCTAQSVSKNRRPAVHGRAPRDDKSYARVPVSGTPK